MASSIFQKALIQLLCSFMEAAVADLVLGISSLHAN